MLLKVPWKRQAQFLDEYVEFRSYKMSGHYSVCVYDGFTDIHLNGYRHTICLLSLPKVFAHDWFFSSVRASRALPWATQELTDVFDPLELLTNNLRF